ncbi:MAG: response regulator [Clostridiaceae bacterium]|nr:response regulator [Clostridiaceae bacterium]
MKKEQKSILVIDDSNSIRSFIKFILEEKNYKVVEAENGLIGIDKFKTENFDLVITDIYMPLCSGLEVVVKLREEYADLKVIVLSDGGEKHFSNVKEVCEDLGACCFLSKANIKNDLLKIVSTIFND